uniref:Uncharacterized protein n=1 Tax=Arcella intermedia TaxID=1963864 RepID=A0A6B2LXE0_9EUKA
MHKSGTLLVMKGSDKFPQPITEELQGWYSCMTSLQGKASKT